MTPKIIKQLNGIKYIATIASTIILIAPLLSVLYLWRNLFKDNLPALNGATFSLWIVGLILFGLYWYLRYKLFQKADYKPIPKEKKQMIISLVSYSTALALTLIYLCVANLSGGDKKVLAYLGIPFIILILAGNAIGSIYESFSRIGLEQIAIVDGEPNIQTSTKLKKKKHTSEAEMLLKEHEKPVELGSDEQDLQDFFDQTDEKDPPKA